MTTDVEFDARLAAVPLLAGVSRRQRRKLLDASKVVEHPANREVATEGLGALALHVIVSGSATVTLRGTVVRTLGPGDYFGDISMIDGRPRSATVTTDGPLQTLAVPHLAVQDLIDKEPDFARQLLTALCARLREAESAPVDT